MNRIIAPIVAKYTDQYIENLDAKHLEVGVLGGTIKLHDLHLKRSALAELNLPMDVVRGSLSKLEISIPWTSLSSKSVVVNIDELFLVAKPKGYGRQFRWIRFTAHKLRNPSLARLRLGAIQLFDDNSAPVTVKSIRAQGIVPDPAWTRAALGDHGHWSEKGAVWEDGKATSVLMELDRERTDVTGYRIFTPPDGDPGSDPVEWVVEGSMSPDPKGRWQPLHSFRSEPVKSAEVLSGMRVSVVPPRGSRSSGIVASLRRDRTKVIGIEVKWDPGQASTGSTVIPAQHWDSTAGSARQDGLPRARGEWATFRPVAQDLVKVREEQAKELLKQRRETLDAADEAERAVKLAEQDSGGGGSFVERLTETIVNNIVLNIKHIHVRFEDDVNDPVPSRSPWAARTGSGRTCTFPSLSAARAAPAEFVSFSRVDEREGIAKGDWVPRVQLGEFQNAYSLGLCFESLQVKSTNSAGEVGFQSDNTAPIFHKKATLDWFGMYVDHGSARQIVSHGIQPFTDWKSWMLKSISTRLSARDAQLVGEGHAWILSPLDLEVRLSMLSRTGKLDIENRQPLVECSVHSRDLGLRLNREQYLSLLGLAQFNEEFNRRAKYIMYRPHVPVLKSRPGGDPMAWWIYVLRCLVVTIRDQKPLNERMIAGKAKVAKDYIQVHKRLQRKPWHAPLEEGSTEESLLNRTRDNYEALLPLGELLRLRRIANKELEHGEKRWQELEASRSARVRQQKAQQTWGQWWRGEKVADEEQDASAAARIDQEAQEAIAQSIGFVDDGADTAEATGRKGPDYRQHQVGLRVDTVSLVLYESVERPLTRLVLKTMGFDLAVRSGGVDVDIDLQDIAVEDLAPGIKKCHNIISVTRDARELPTAQTAVTPEPTMQTPADGELDLQTAVKPGRAAAASTFASALPPSGVTPSGASTPMYECDEDRTTLSEDQLSSFFHLHFESAPVSGKADQVLRLMLEQMDIWFVPSWLTRLLRLFRIPGTIKLGSLEAATSAALADGLSAATRQLKLAVEDRSQIDLDVTLAAPRLWIANSEVEQETAGLMADLGMLRMRSQVDPQRKEKIKKGGVSEDDHYDKYSLDLSGVALAVAQFSGAKGDPRRVLLRDLAVHLSLANCLTPDVETLPNLKVQGKMPPLKFRVCPTTVGEVLRTLSVVTDWLADPSGEAGPPEAADSSRGPRDPSSIWSATVEVSTKFEHVGAQASEDDRWESYQASYFPDSSKLLLRGTGAASEAPPTFVYVGRLTEVATEEDRVLLRLPQSYGADRQPSAFVDVAVRGTMKGPQGLAQLQQQVRASIRSQAEWYEQAQQELLRQKAQKANLLEAGLTSLWESKGKDGKWHRLDARLGIALEEAFGAAQRNEAPRDAICRRVDKGDWEIVAGGDKVTMATDEEADMLELVTEAGRERVFVDGAKVFPFDENLRRVVTAKPCADSKVLVQGGFTVDEIALVLTTDLEAGSGSNVVDVGLHEVHVDLSMRPKDLRASMSMRELSVRDLLRPEGSDPTFLGLLSAEGTSNGTKVSFEQLQPASPLYRGVGLLLSTSCNELRFHMERETLPTILGFLTRFADAQTEQAAPVVYQEREPKKVTTAEAAAEDKEDSGAMQVEVDMDKLSSHFSNAAERLFSCTTSHSTVLLRNSPEELSVSASLGGFVMHDHSAWNLHFKEMVSCATAAGTQSVLRAEFTQSQTAKPPAPGAPFYQAKCKVQMGRSKVVYLQRGVGSLARYFDVGYLMSKMPKSTVGAAAAYATEAASAARKMAAEAAAERATSCALTQLDISVEKPTLVVPYAPTRTKIGQLADHAELVLGMLEFRTALGEAPGAVWTEHMHIQITETSFQLHDSIMSAHHGPARPIIKDWSCTIEGNRRVVGRRKDHPDMKLNSTIGDIKVELSKQQYDGIMLILSTNVGDDWSDTRLEVVENEEAELGAVAGPAPAAGDASREAESSAAQEEEGLTLDFAMDFKHMSIRLDRAPTQEEVKAVAHAHGLAMSASLERLREAVEGEGYFRDIMRFSLQGLEVSHKGDAAGVQTSVVRLRSIVIEDARPAAPSGPFQRIFVFGQDEGESSVELVSNEMGPSGMNTRVTLPEARVNLVPAALQEVLGFVASPAMPAQYKLDAIRQIHMAERRGDVVIGEDSYHTLERTLYLGPTHRLLVKCPLSGPDAPRHQRVVLDGHSLHDIYLTGNCNCRRSATALKDALRACIAVQPGCELVLRNVRVHCVRSLEEYIFPGSHVDLDRCQVLCKETPSASAAAGAVGLPVPAAAEAKAMRVFVSMRRGLRVMVPEDAADPDSRVLVVAVQGLAYLNTAGGADRRTVTVPRAAVEFWSRRLGEEQPPCAEACGLDSEVSEAELEWAALPVDWHEGAAVVGNIPADSLAAKVADRLDWPLAGAELLSVGDVEFPAIEGLTCMGVVAGLVQALSATNDVNIKVTFAVRGDVRVDLQNLGLRPATARSLAQQQHGSLLHSILGPSSVVLSTTTRQGPGLTRVNLSICATNIGLRVSYRDIKVLLAASEGLSAALAALGNDSTEAEARDLLVHLPGDQETHTGAAAGPVPVTSTEVRIRLAPTDGVAMSGPALFLQLVDDKGGYAADLLRFDLAGAASDGCSGRALEINFRQSAHPDWGSHFVATLPVAYSLSYLNPATADWEPMLERHSTRLHVTQRPTGNSWVRSTLVLEVGSLQKRGSLRLNLSSEAITRLMEVSTDWGEGLGGGKGERGSKVRSACNKYVVLNHTGLKLTIKGTFAPGHGEGEQSNVRVLSGKPCEFNLAPRETSSLPQVSIDLGGQRGLRDLFLVASGASRRQMLEIPRGMVGQDRLQDRMLHATAREVGGQLFMTLSSRFTVRNCTALDLEVRVSRSTDAEAAVIPLKAPRAGEFGEPLNRDDPRAEVGIPIWALPERGGDTFIEVRPAGGTHQGRQYRWSTSDGRGAKLAITKASPQAGDLTCFDATAPDRTTTVAFHFSRRRVLCSAVDGRHALSQEIIEVSAPILFENLLPCPVQISWQNSVQKPWQPLGTVVLKAGEHSVVHNVYSLQDVWATFNVMQDQDLEEDRAPFLVHRFEHEDDSDKPRVKLSGPGRHNVVFNLLCRRRNTVRALREVAIYVPYWIINLSPYTKLRVEEENPRTSNTIAVGNARTAACKASETVGPPPILLYSAPDPDDAFSGKLRVSIQQPKTHDMPHISTNPSNWFQYDTVNVPGTISCSGDHGTQRSLGVQIELAPGRFQRTKIIKFFQRWCLRNLTSHTLKLRRHKEEEVACTLYSGGADVPDSANEFCTLCSVDGLRAGAKLADGEMEPLCITLDSGIPDGRQHWSNPFSINDQGTQYVCVCGEVVEVRVVQKEAVCWVLFQEAGRPPMRIVNNTFEEARVQSVLGRCEYGQTVVVPSVSMQCFYPERRKDGKAEPEMRVVVGGADCTLKAVVGTGRESLCGLDLSIDLGKDSLLCVIDYAAGTRSVVRRVAAAQTTRSVCYHREFLNCCNKCQPDGKQCVWLPAGHLVGCSHKDFWSCCRKCTRVDGSQVRIVRVVCRHRCFAGHCGDCTPNDKRTCVVLRDGERVVCEHNAKQKSCCERCTRVDGRRVQISKVRAPEEEEKEQAAASASKGAAAAPQSPTASAARVEELIEYPGIDYPDGGVDGRQPLATVHIEPDVGCLADARTRIAQVLAATAERIGQPVTNLFGCWVEPNLLCVKKGAKEFNPTVNFQAGDPVPQHAKAAPGTVLFYPGGAVRSSEGQEPEWCAVRLMTNVGVSLIHAQAGERYELAYLSLSPNKGDPQSHGLYVELLMQEQALSLDFMIGHIQLDNQMQGASFPVAICTGLGAMARVSDRRQLNSGERDKPPCALHLAVVQFSVREGAMTTMACCDFLLQALQVQLDDVFLFAVLDYLSTLLPATGDADEFRAAVLRQPEYDPQVDGGGSSQRLYAGLLRVQPIRLNLTFQAERPLSAAGSRFGDLLATLAMAVEKHLAVEDATLRLNLFELQPANGSQSEIVGIIIGHYTSQAIREAYRLVGALEFLGNPGSLFGNIGNGVADLFYEPINGMTKGPKEFARGLGTGTVSAGRHVLYGGLSTLTGVSKTFTKACNTLALDREHAKAYRARQREKPKDAFQGVAHGAKAMGTGVKDGITGIFMKPIEGAREGSVTGFAGGVVKGIVGAPFKIVGGVLEGVGKVAEGSRSQVAGSAGTARRMRPPRAFPGGALRDYDDDSLVDAWAQNVLHYGGFFTDRLELVTKRWSSRGQESWQIFSDKRMILVDVTERSEAEFRAAEGQQVVPYFDDVGRALWTQMRAVDDKTLAIDIHGFPEVTVTFSGKEDMEAVLVLMKRLLPQIKLVQWMFPHLSDSKEGEVEVYENQRRLQGSIWDGEQLPGDRPAWSDATGRQKRPKIGCGYYSPPQGCVWVSDWECDRSDSTDPEGWTYAPEFGAKDWRKAPSRIMTVRRRRWVRRYAPAPSDDDMAQTRLMAASAYHVDPGADSPPARAATGPVKLVCCHTQFEKHCGRCAEDGESCVRIPEHSRIVCAHERFHACCARCTKVDGKDVVPARHVCHHYGFRGYCGKQCYVDDKNCLLLRPNHFVACKHTGFRECCEHCTAVDGKNVRVMKEEGRDLFEVSQMASSTAGGLERHMEHGEEPAEREAAGARSPKIREESVYENQRHYPIAGWSNSLLPTDRSRWSDEHGQALPGKDAKVQPGWRVLSDWQVDRSAKVDRDGWQYAKDFGFTFRPSKGLIDCVRRRKWVRQLIENP